MQLRLFSSLGTNESAHKYTEGNKVVVNSKRHKLTLIQNNNLHISTPQ